MSKGASFYSLPIPASVVKLSDDARRIAVTIDYLLIGVGTLLVLLIGMFLIKLRTVNARLRVLQAQIEEMHILTTRLLLRELNAPGASRASLSGKSAHDDGSAPDEPQPALGSDAEIPAERKGALVGRQSWLGRKT
jgi:hypothetical protein